MKQEITETPKLHFIEKEDYEKGFSAYFDGKIRPLLKTAGSERDDWLARIKKKKRIGIIVFAAILVISTGLVVVFNEMKNQVAFVAALMTGGLFIYMMDVNFRAILGNRIIPEVLRFFGDFRYKHEGCLQFEELRKSPVFNFFNSGAGEDYVEGNYKGHKVRFSEMTLEHSSDYGSTTVFKGTIIIIDIARVLNGCTAVRPREKNNLWKAAYKKLKNIREVEIDNGEFNDKYELLSTDPDEARSLVTASLLRGLKPLEDVSPERNVSCGFFENKLLVAISDKKGSLFDMDPLFKKAMDAVDVRRILAQMHAILEVVDTVINTMDARACGR